MEKLKIINFFVFFVIFVFFSVNPGFPIEDTNEEEIILDTIHLKIEENRYSENQKNKNIFYEIGKPTGSPADLFRSSGYSFESGPVKNQKFRYFFHGGNLFTVRADSDLSNTTQFIANEIQSITLFADNKTTLMAGYNFSRNTNYDNNFFEKVSFLFLDSEINKNQHVLLGEMRVPIGVEGGIPSSYLKLVSRSQIARTHGNYVSNGIQNTGKYKYCDYNIGFYDASRFLNNNFKGYEFAGLISFKPLDKFDGKYGNLKIGGSFDVGNSENSFAVTGAHASYIYKKLYADFEYLYANGSSGVYYGKGRSHGLYTTVSYFILPKLEILGRYDFFQNLENDKVTLEYTAGASYHLNPHTRLMLNYIFAKSDTEAVPSHKIYIGADFMSSFLLDLL